MAKTYTVLKQHWIESERGWGIRPDGNSYHLTTEDRDPFIKEYWARMPKEVPDEYSRPYGKPTVIEVKKSFYKEVRGTKNGLRQY